MSGAALLGITNALVRQAMNGPIISQGDGLAIVVPKAAGTGTGAGQHALAGPTPSASPAPAVPGQESLIANLVDNALRHNVPDGRVEVETRIKGGQAVVSVANTGAVVPAAVVDRLFQPFQRLATNRAGGHDEGVGLGLYIVWAITQAYGSTLTVRPRDEGGLHIESSFRLHPAAALQRLACAC